MREPLTFLKLIQVLAYAITAGAVFVAAFAYHDYATASKVESWLPVDARITKLNVDEEHTKDRYGNISTYYQPRIYYEYNVQPGKHAGLFSPSSVASNEQKVAAAYLTRFRVGGVIQTYYDPKDPVSSAVIRGDKDYSRNLMIEAVAAFFGSLLVLIWLSRRDYALNGSSRRLGGHYRLPRNAEEFFR